MAHALDRWNRLDSVCCAPNRIQGHIFHGRGELMVYLWWTKGISIPSGGTF